MAYSRRRRTTRRKRRVFSKRAEKAIVRLATKPVETKRFPYINSITGFFNDAGYISGPTAVIARNAFGPIPRENNTLTNTAHTMVGDEIMARGLRFELHLYGLAATAGSMYDAMFRFTVFEMSDYYASTFGVSPSDASIFDQEHNNVPTWSKWNVQNVNIRKQSTFRWDNNGNLNAILRRKFYVPIRRKLTAVLEGTTVTNGFLREVKGTQIYWALEIFVPGFALAGDLKTFIQGNVDTNVYFKDP